MKLDAWQARLAVEALKTAAHARRGAPYRLRTLEGQPAIRARDAARELEHGALEAMATALESGESLEVGP